MVPRAAAGTRQRLAAHQFQQEDPFPKSGAGAAVPGNESFPGPALRHALRNGSCDIGRCRAIPSVLRPDLLITLTTLRGVEIHAAEKHGQRGTVDFDGQ